MIKIEDVSLESNTYLVGWYFIYTDELTLWRHEDGQLKNDLVSIYKHI